MPARLHPDARGCRKPYPAKPGSGQCYALDDIGAVIWSLCDGAHSVADIVAAIVSEYDAPVETVEADTMELLQDLIHEKLLLEGH